MEYELAQVYKRFFVGIGCLLFVWFLMGCAKQEIPLPANAENVVETSNMIVYTTADKQEHIVCKDRSAITYSKDAVMLDSPSCDKNASALINMQGKQIFSSVNLNNYEPTYGETVSVNYHFELITPTDSGKTTVFFDDCIVGVNDETPTYQFGRSAFSVTADAVKDVVIVCKNGDQVIAARFVITPK